MHSIAARLRHSIAFVPRGAFVDGALAAFAGFADAIVLRHMRCDAAGAKTGHMIGRVIALQLRFLRSSESIGHHDSEIVDDGYFD
jgi:hypothetical protein